MLLAVLAYLLLQPAADGPDLLGRAVTFTDGDTIDVLDDAKTTRRIRLAGIDAPERAQPFSRRARHHLSEGCFREDVTVRGLGKDNYGRIIGQAWVEGDGACLSLPQAWLAWHYLKYDQSPEYAETEAAAKAAKRGLWRDPRPVPPWDWKLLPKADRDAARNVTAGIDD